MRKFIILAAIIGSALISEAQQPAATPWATETESFNPLYSFKVNSAGVYFNTWTPTNQGTQWDTTCSTCRQSPLRLGTAKIIKRSPTRNDTTFPLKLTGEGKVTISYEVYKSSITSTVNPVCVTTLYQSDDFYSWSPVSGVAAQTLTPTSVYSSTLTAAPFTNSFTGIDRGASYYMLNFAVTGDSVAARSQIHYTLRSFSSQ